MGLVAPRHVGSSQTRARTRVPCTSRQTLNHCATREALCISFDPAIPLSGKHSSEKFKYVYKDLTLKCWASLVVQWLRIRLPMQGTWVQALVWKDPTCRGATKPVCHNYRACALELASHNYWAHVPQLLKPARLEPVLCNKRSHLKERPVHRNEE